MGVLSLDHTEAGRPAKISTTIYTTFLMSGLLTSISETFTKKQRNGYGLNINPGIMMLKDLTSEIYIHLVSVFPPSEKKAMLSVTVFSLSSSIFY